MWQNKDAFNDDVTDTNWWWGKARMEIVFACMEDIVPRNANILEVGAGYGRMTTMLSQFGTVKAIEPYPEAVNYLQKLGINTYQGTFESFNEPDKYDLVACFDVLEHIKDDKEAISKMESLIKDKGFLVITVPAYKFLWNRHDKMNDHYRRYTKGSLLRVIPDNLVVKKISYYNTLLFPLAVLDKLVLTKNKKSYSFNPNKIVNGMLYKVFVLEKKLLKHCNLPFGVSILLIAEKNG
jgi:2-polyprenyl-3-methyl-5-hydroxy-6-metoxy-1,4-benzoquinol methylase